LLVPPKRFEVNKPSKVFGGLEGSLISTIAILSYG
jgi:hypothetical protein